jgi:two-component system nitrogen regulation sensor histidine kinase NtrY
MFSPTRKRRPKPVPIPLSPAEERDAQIKIRNRLVGVAGLMLAIGLLFVTLLYTTGFHDPQTTEINWTVFVAVSVNIVVLTTVFYLILRNLFKLVYERRRPLAGVGLKTKLIIAFVALSLPSTGFHLLTSGFLAFLFDSWSRGEHRHVLDSAAVVMNALDTQEAAFQARIASDAVAALPKGSPTGRSDTWIGTYRPPAGTALFLYNEKGQIVARWTPGSELAQAWTVPPPERAHAYGPMRWSEPRGERTAMRLIVQVPNRQPELRLEVLTLRPPETSKATALLTRRQENRLFLGRDLLLLLLSILVVMTLFIIFAATWMAFYLARGFVTPIEQLDGATQRVSQGDLGHQVEIGGMGPLRADFRGLVHSFNQMSRQLRDQREALVRSSEDLRRSGRQLEERNKLVELLLETIDAGIAAVNLNGDISALNREAVRLLQPRSDWLSRPYQEVLPRDSAKLVQGMREALLERTQRGSAGVFTLSIQGQPVHVEASGLRLSDDKGEPQGLVLMLKDVTQLQRTQRALAWREVARRVAHEIKNPLQPIQTSAERIRRKYLDILSADGTVLDQCTQTIIEKVKSLKQMVNEFSQFATLPEAKPVPDDLNEVIGETARSYEHSLPEQIRVRLELDSNLPPFPLDREQLKRAFANLIDNAAASIHGKGEIVLRSRYDAAERRVWVEVADDGSGVPEEIRKRLFEPYTSTKVGGTGLGLTIVNQIVSDHNGQVRYAPNLPHGSVFSMDFRLA